jgi:hypothetical protein
MKFLDVELMENRKGNYSKSIKALSLRSSSISALAFGGWKKFPRAVSEGEIERRARRRRQPVAHGIDIH